MTMLLKDPGSTLDWPNSWQLESGETIVGQTWAVFDVTLGSTVPGAGGLGLVAGSQSIAGPLTSTMLAGGVPGHVYSVINAITTNAGRTAVATDVFRIGTVGTQ
jgi:hypothetical protein